MLPSTLFPPVSIAEGDISSDNVALLSVGFISEGGGGGCESLCSVVVGSSVWLLLILLCLLCFPASSVVASGELEEYDLHVTTIKPKTESTDRRRYLKTSNIKTKFDKRIEL